MNRTWVIVVLSVLLAAATVAAVHQHLAYRRAAYRIVALEGGRIVPRIMRDGAATTPSERESASMDSSAYPANTSSGEEADASQISNHGTAAAETAASAESRRDRASATREEAPPQGSASRNASGGARGDAAGSGSRREAGATGAQTQAAEKSRSLSAQAQRLMQDGDYERAGELLRESLEQDVANTRAWKQMAQLQRTLGLTDDELTTYQQWMEALPTDAEPYYMMAEAYARVGMDMEARDYLARYEGLATDTTGEFVRMSSLYRRINAREDEGRILAQWTEVAPESMDARHAWADYQRRMGNYGEALGQYEYMATVTPENPLPYRQMGDIYRRHGDYTQAQQQYETALAVRPGDIATMNRLAQTRQSAGDLYGAMDVYAEIIALEPGSNAAQQAERRLQILERQAPR